MHHPAVFVQDPERFLNLLPLELRCSVDPDAPAVLEPSHRTIVNSQFYWVSSPASAETFRSAPYKYTGPLKDPVAHEWFTPTESSPRRDLGNQILYFQDEDTARAFDQHPGAYGP